MHSVDRGLFITFILLTLFGLVMMSSMSVAGSFDLVGRNNYYFVRHFLYIVIGIPVFLLAFKFPLDLLRRVSPLVFMFAVSLLILVLLIGQDFGTAAKSWLKIGPFSIQPTEVMKLSIIIFLSAVFAGKSNQVGKVQGGLIPFMFILGIPAILIMAQPDFGSLLVLVLTAAAIYFVAGANIQHVIGGAGVAVVTGSVVILSNDYIQRRINVFLNPDLDPMGAGYQVKQALIAIGSGGVFGRGFQNSVQKFDYLPEVQSDTIFAAIAEELGFVRILILLGAYFYIAYRGFLIAQNSQNEFNRLLAVGITCWILFQAMINIGVNLALLPNTGITLPLISYGGTSLWATFAAFGILLQLSTQTTDNKRRKYVF